MFAANLGEPLHLRAGSMGGNVGGRLLYCDLGIESFRLPPGRYKISAPMRNSVYGTFALVSPVGGWNQEQWIGPALHEKWIGPSYHEKWIGPAFGEKGWLGPSGMKWSGPSAVQDKFVTLEPGKQWLGGMSIVPLGAIVVSDRRLAGRNCLVIVTHFADLMDALEAAGGALVSVY